MRALAEMENSGLVPLLMADRTEDLARMHALFARVDGGSELLRAGMVRMMEWHTRRRSSKQTPVGMSVSVCDLSWQVQLLHAFTVQQRPDAAPFVCLAELGERAHASCVPCYLGWPLPCTACELH